MYINRDFNVKLGALFLKRMQMLENYLSSVLTGWSVLLCTRFWDIKYIKFHQPIMLYTIKILAQYYLRNLFSDCPCIPINPSIYK